MMARRGVLGILAGGAAFVLGGCSILSSNYSYRYKMTVEVDTPEGLKTGYAVHETLVSKSNVDLGDISQKQNSETRGEAVAVDLPGGQTLFVLMPNDVAVINALDPAGTGGWLEKALRVADGDIPDGPQALLFSAPQNYNKSGEFPLFVRFQDINNPKTVELVRPDNLAASFGGGVKLKGVTVEATDEDVTVGIETRLRWLKSYTNKQLAGNRFPILNDQDRISARISAGSFTTELQK